ncbi:MAG: AmmeMemoRadiSam system protein B, partial [Chloracidobacterium sp. CP2_5A]
MFSLPERPRLRPLQLFADEAAGLIVIHDPQDFIEDFGLDLRLAPLLLACDGQNTLDDLPGALAQQFRQPWSPEEVTAIVAQLDEWLLLDSPRFAALAARRIAEFRSAPIRPAACAGSSYPAEPDALRRRLDEILGQSKTPAIAAECIAELVGVVAPHIDLRVGERAYAPAYRLIERFAASLPSREPVTFVVLGTSHYGGDGLFIASRKAYATPCGALACDLDFLDRLEARLGYSISADDRAHRQEHSIEFQAVFLRHIF